MSVDQLKPFVRRLAERAEQRAFNWMMAHNPTRDDYREAINLFSGVYAQSAGLLAADWYNRLNEKSRFTARLDDDLVEEKLDNIADWVFDGPQSPQNRGRLAAHRLVFDAARRTVFVAAAEEGVAIGRHEGATSCSKCIVKATLDIRPQDASSEDIDQDFHPKCEGLFIPARTGPYEPPAHAAKWRQMVAEARDAGKSSPEEIALWLKSH